MFGSYGHQEGRRGGHPHMRGPHRRYDPRLYASVTPASTLEDKLFQMCNGDPECVAKAKAALQAQGALPADGADPTLAGLGFWGKSARAHAYHKTQSKKKKKAAAAKRKRQQMMQQQQSQSSGSDDYDDDSDTGDDSDDDDGSLSGGVVYAGMYGTAFGANPIGASQGLRGYGQLDIMYGGVEVAAADYGSGDNYVYGSMMNTDGAVEALAIPVNADGTPQSGTDRKGSAKFFHDLFAGIGHGDPKAGKAAVANAAIQYGPDVATGVGEYLQAKKDSPEALMRKIAKYKAEYTAARRSGNIVKATKAYYKIRALEARLDNLGAGVEAVEPGGSIAWSSSFQAGGIPWGWVGGVGIAVIVLAAMASKKK